MNPETHQERLDRLRIPLLTPTGRDAELAEALLENDGLACERCTSFEHLLGLVEAGCGPVLIAEEALSEARMACLGDALDAQPSWSDLPVIIIAKRGKDNGRIRRLVKRRSTSILKRPILTEVFLTTVRMATETRKRQYEVRDLLHHLRKLNQRLEDRTHHLKRLAMELTNAEERERRRLADALHDDLQQILVGVRFRLSALDQGPESPSALRESLSYVDKLLEDAIELSRNLSHQLCPPILGQNGLIAALNWLAVQMNSLHGMQVNVVAEAEAEPHNEQVSILIYRSIQEFLFNVVKHAGTGHAEVRLLSRKGGIEASVQDDGCGFDVHAMHKDSGGLGLFNIEERVSTLEGNLQIRSTPGQGTCITLSLPAPMPLDAGSGNENVPAPMEGFPVREAVETPASERPFNALRVLIVDDHGVMREGVRALLRQEPTITVVGEAENGKKAIDMAVEMHPDVIIMDVAMPVMDGIEATRQIKRHQPEIEIIAMSMFEEPETIRRMLQAGASAYVPKGGPSKQLVRAVLDTCKAPRLT